jgi:hypothetical protein
MRELNIDLLPPHRLRVMLEDLTVEMIALGYNVRLKMGLIGVDVSGSNVDMLLAKKELRRRGVKVE